MHRNESTNLSHSWLATKGGGPNVQSVSHHGMEIPNAGVPGKAWMKKAGIVQVRLEACMSEEDQI